MWRVSILWCGAFYVPVFWTEDERMAEWYAKGLRGRTTRVDWDHLTVTRLL